MSSAWPPIRIRSYESADAEATLRIFEDAITVTAAADYTPDQVEAWARPGQRDLHEWDRGMLERESCVALVGDQLAGFSDVSADGYVGMMFVSPRFARRGVARELMNFIELRARRNSARQLSSNVSITARPFFEALGFQVEAEQHPVAGGVVMTNFHMTKKLTKRHLLSLQDWDRAGLGELFDLVDQYVAGTGPQFDAAAAMFFPSSSLRTRFSFERGASRMGIQPIVFPPETLDRSEDLIDVAGYLAQWAGIMVVRHSDIGVLERLASAEALPVVNAMTAVNHPCEVLSDLYALARGAEITELRYLFVGANGNISGAWREAARAFGLDITQCCPEDLRVPGMPWERSLPDAIRSADVVITDGPGPHADALAPYRVTAELLDNAPPGVKLAPCPPFIRGREVSADAAAHESFVGYGFKRFLMPVQQAVMARGLVAG